jgi:hypothetical protein
VYKKPKELYSLDSRAWHYVTLSISYEIINPLNITEPFVAHGPLHLTQRNADTRNVWSQNHECNLKSLGDLGAENSRKELLIPANTQNLRVGLP